MTMLILTGGIAVGIFWLLLRLLRVGVGRLKLQTYWKQQLLREPPDGAIRLVALGDSISQGVGATAPQYTLVGRAAAYIQSTTKRPVWVKNYSVSGATSDHILSQQLARADLKQADIVMLEIGANDTRRLTVKEWRENMGRILAMLPLKKTIIADVPHVKRRAEYQQVLEELLHGRDIIRAQYSPAFDNSKRRTIVAGDFFHPNNKGYALWFEAFRPGIDIVLKQRSLLKAARK